jgi:hypothetical protein
MNNEKNNKKLRSDQVSTANYYNSYQCLPPENSKSRKISGKNQEQNFSSSPALFNRVWEVNPSINPPSPSCVEEGEGKMERERG